MLDLDPAFRPVRRRDGYLRLEDLGLIGDGATVVLVEQDLARALSVAGQVLCLLEGRVVLRSSTSDVTREQVTEAYFGLSHNGGGV